MNARSPWVEEIRRGTGRPRAHHRVADEDPRRLAVAEVLDRRGIERVVHPAELERRQIAGAGRVADDGAVDGANRQRRNERCRDDEGKRPRRASGTRGLTARNGRRI
jgi:hypothetical protein